MIGFSLFFISSRRKFNKKMKYLIAKFSIDSPDNLKQACRDLLADSMAGAGFESFEETEAGLNGYVCVDSYDEEAMRKAISEFPIEGVEITVEMREAEDKDWNETWEQEGFDPIVIDDRVIIFDAKRGNTDLTPEPIIKIGIDARQAFGTGTHATTRLVISAMLGMNLNQKRVLDCGCGTGILGIAALKMGAKEVVGYDIDEWSVENTRHNASLNQESDITVYHGNSAVLNHVSGVFNLVVANINRNILLADMSVLRGVMGTESGMIISGFYEEDIPMLTEKAEELGFRLVDRSVEDRWACLVFRS